MQLSRIGTGICMHMHFPSSCYSSSGSITEAIGDFESDTAMISRLWAKTTAPSFATLRSASYSSSAIGTADEDEAATATTGEDCIAAGAAG